MDIIQWPPPFVQRYLPLAPALMGSTACGNIPKGAKVFPSKTTFLEAQEWQQTAAKTADDDES